MGLFLYISILEKLDKYEKIHYAGDFDIKGLEIAYNLKNKLQDKLEFLFYDEKHYKKTVSDIVLDENKVRYLDKYRCEELNEIINCLQKEKKVGYQELLIEDYLHLLNK